MSALDELTGLISNKLGAIKSLISITKLEGRLAGLSVFPFIICIIFFLVTLIGVWLSATILLGYLIWLYYGQIIYSLISTLLINILLLGFLGKCMLSNLRKMSFIKTRKYFDDILTMTENDRDECTEETADGNSRSGKKITKSTKPST